MVHKFPNELLNLPNLGRKSFDAINKELWRFGLHFRGVYEHKITTIILRLSEIEGKLTNQDIQRFLLSLLGTDKELTAQNIKRAIILTSSIDTLGLSAQLDLVKGQERELLRQLDTLGLSAHSEDVLKRAGIKHILEELVRKKERELLRHGIKEIKEALSGLGLNLGMEWPFNPGTDVEQIEQEAFLALLLSPVHTLELSVRSVNVLKNNHIEFIWELVQKTERELLRLPNFGRKSLNEIKEALSGLGLSVGMSSGMGIDFTWFLKIERMKQKVILPLDPELIENLILASHSGIGSRTFLDYLSVPLPPLTPIEEKVIKLLFGIEEEKRHTVREIGQYLNRSLTRVEQIKDSAFRKLFMFGGRLKLKYVKDPIIPDDRKEIKEIAERIFQNNLSWLPYGGGITLWLRDISDITNKEGYVEVPEKKEEKMNQLKEPSPLLLIASIVILNLPWRSHFALEDNGIDFILELVQKTEDELSSLNILKEHLNEIKRALSRFDLDLGMDINMGFVRKRQIEKSFIPEAYSQVGSMGFFHYHMFLGPMNSREEKVLRMRFGLEAGRRYSLEELGKYFGITSERIRFIEKRAFGKFLLQFGKKLRVVEYSAFSKQQRKKKMVELVFQTLLPLHRGRQQSFRQIESSSDRVEDVGDEESDENQI